MINMFTILILDVSTNIALHYITLTLANVRTKHTSATEADGDVISFFEVAVMVWAFRLVVFRFYHHIS